jgi:hypothetical protein
MERIVELLRRWLELMRGSQKSLPSGDSLRRVAEVARELEASIAATFRELTTLERLTYEEAIGWFKTARPPNIAVSKGAMLRVRSERGVWLVTQVFLAADNTLVVKPDGAPLGRRLEVRLLDDELTDLFGDHDLVVVE